MYSIGGILTVDQYQEAWKTIIRRMQTYLRHCSPDDSGIYISSEKQPDWVVNRTKRGLPFLFEQWITGEWRDYFSHVNIPNNISLKPWYCDWSLAILKYWWERISK